MSWGATFTHYACPNCDGHVYSTREDFFHGPVIEEIVEHSDMECGHCLYPSPIPNMRLMNQLSEKRRRKEKDSE